MDRALYVGMSGAIATLRAQAANNHNLANASTVGFRAELAAAQAQGIDGPGFASRVHSELADGGWDAQQGPMMNTGEALDIALHGDHWLAVQLPDGSEAYTRAGDLRLDANGQLRTAAGLAVLGDGGPIAVPVSTSITIGGDGTISAVPQGQAAAAQIVVGRLKVVSAGADQLQRGNDGLMRAKDGFTPEPAAGTVLTSGALEGSNVNLASAMVNMIHLARQFELQSKVMRSADDNAQAASSLLKLG